MGGAKFCRFALFPLMLLMLLLLPAGMVAQTEYDNTVTFTALEGNPEGYDNESYANLFDGKKEDGKFSKWCCKFSGSAYVIFEASKAGIPVGYTITTGNDNANSGCGGRNPKSWKLYGNNTGSDDAWELIDEVNKDKVLQDKNYTSYNFDCKCSTSYQYFKWEISAIRRGSLLQVGEFELKLNTCSHKNADGSSALGEAIKTVEATCIEYGYTTHECSICHSIVKVDNDELNKHTLTRHAQEDATCIETGKKEYWQCSVCNKLFSDDNATTEITDAASLEIPAKGHQYNSEGICTGCGATEFRYPLFNNLDGITDVTITDNDYHPWQKLDLKADGMDNLGFTIPEDSKGLMSGNYHKPGSSSETVIRFNVSKPILLTSQILVSSEENKTLFDFYVDNNKELSISGKKQTEYKVLLSVGEHSLRLVYKKGNRSDANADRAFLYNLKTSVTIDDYVADYESSNNTLTFKKVTSNNIESLDLNHAVIVNKPTVGDMCRLLGINSTAIKSVVFDKSFKTYAPTSLYGFFRGLTMLETIKDLKYLNTEQVTNMSYMFSDCSALTSLDLSNFNTAKVRDMSYMFSRCSALTTIYASDKFVTSKVQSGENMFSACRSLKDYRDSKTAHKYANYKTGYFSKLVGKNGDEKIGATGESLATDNLVLDDDKDFVAYEPFAAKAASYNRTMKAGTIWATLCLPFAIVQSQETECKFYRLTGIDNDNECITLESCEGAEIPAGTPVLFKMNEGEQTLSISAQDASIVTEPKAGTNTDVNLVGSFTKIGGKDNQGLAGTDYIIGKDKFWRVSDLNDGKGVGIKPMRAYIHPATASQARAAMLSIGKGDGTTVIDNLNAISNDANAEYYDANGRRTNGLQKGLNIVKRGSKTYKIMVK